MTIFETDLFATNKRSVLPFKIVVECKSENGINQVTTKRIEYTKIQNGKIITEMPQETILSQTVWKD